MEGKEYVLRLPLQQIALRKTAILLWNRFYSDSLISLSSTKQTLEFLVKKVQERVPLLSLPSSIEKKLIDLMLPIGTEIQRWKEYHQSMLSVTVAKSELGHLCWTSQGTVDYRKTAERLIKLEKVNNVTSYKLSCLYCFDNDILKFWETLNESTKKNYYYDKTFTDFFEDESRFRRAKLVSLWTSFLKVNTNFIIRQNEIEPRRTFNQFAFESAAMSGNKVATEYFFQKLTFEEREISLMETAERVIEKRCLSKYYYPQDFPAEKFSDVGIYLLSQLSKAEQTEIFEKLPFATLVCFLYWPWQDLFMDIIEQLWAFLSFEKFRGLLTIVSDDYNKPAFNYGKIFSELFLQSPSHYRKSLMLDHSFESEDVYFDYSLFPILYKDLPDLRMEWFCNLFKTSKSECIKLVLRSINSLERERLIISKFGVELCGHLVSRGKWFLLELILEACTLSNEAKKTLKSSFMEYFFSNQDSGYLIRISILRKKKFLEVLDNSVSVSSKRRIEELETEQSASPKKKS